MMNKHWRNDWASKIDEFSSMIDKKNRDLIKKKLIQPDKKIWTKMNPDEINACLDTIRLEKRLTDSAFICYILGLEFYDFLVLAEIFFIIRIYLARLCRVGGEVELIKNMKKKSKTNYFRLIICFLLRCKITKIILYDKIVRLREPLGLFYPLDNYFSVVFSSI